MSLQVAVRIRHDSPVETWAHFSDEMLSKHLDWRLTQVKSVRDSSNFEHQSRGYHVTSSLVSVWIYEVNPHMIVEDVFDILRVINNQGHLFSVHLGSRSDTDWESATEWLRYSEVDGGFRPFLNQEWSSSFHRPKELAVTK